MDRMAFTQGVTRTRVLENKLLNRPAIEKLVDAKDLEEVLRVLGDTEYSAAIGAVEKENDYEGILLYELKRVYKMMRELSADPRVVDILALRYDYHNIKVMLKEKLMSEDLTNLNISLGTMDFSKLKAYYTSGTFRDMDPRIREAIEHVEKDFEDKNDPQRIDILLDIFYFKHLFEITDELKVDLFTQYVKDMIDFLNVSTAVRLKKQGKDLKFFEEVILYNGNIEKDVILLTLNESIDVMMNRFRNARISRELLAGLDDYQETGRLSVLEKHMDNYLINLNKSSKSITFGPEPIFSYLVAKEMEIKTLRIIMVSKMNNIPPEAIRERLRDLYV